MILDCLRHWAEQMHVDGFRFDLAASLSRDERGEPVDRPPLLLEIEGMKCGGCVRAVEQRLLAQPGVHQASVNLLTRTAWVELDRQFASLWRIKSQVLCDFMTSTPKRLRVWLVWLPLSARIHWSKLERLTLMELISFSTRPQ
jgi:copper chaperone CopZ